MYSRARDLAVLKKMPRVSQLVAIDTTKKSPSPLTQELKDFIDRAIVPALVEQYLDEIELAKKDADAANSGQQHGRTGVRTVRP